MGKDKRYKRMGAALTTGHYAPPCGKETCDGTKTKKARDATSRRSKTTTTRNHPSIARFGAYWSDCGRESSSVRRCGSRGWLRCHERARSRHPTTRSTLSIKGTCTKYQGSSHHALAYWTSTPVSSEYLESSRSSDTSRTLASGQCRSDQCFARIGHEHASWTDSHIVVHPDQVTTPSTSTERHDPS